MTPDGRERPVSLVKESSIETDARPVLITGGAGFIGCNVAHAVASSGQRVLLFDNFSRAGVAKNVAWLRQTHGDLIETVVGDVRDPAATVDVVNRAGRVFHFAAQVAVTTSLEHAIDDFAVNAHGTLNVLEAVRAAAHRPPLLFTSTNKVYGALDDVPLVCGKKRYTPLSPAIRAAGIDEDRRLAFYTPYGCSKGAADQYVLDYARTFGLRAAVFRMSCIYGPHQFGTEDQGWIAHFIIRALKHEPIVLYGDGRQVRDVLFVDDLVKAMLLAQRHIDRLSGQVFNIGGGPQNTLSLLELLDLIAELREGHLDVRHDAWRTGDQRYYVSDTSRFNLATGWVPTVNAQEGVRRLHEWLLRSVDVSIHEQDDDGAHEQTAGWRAIAGGAR